MKFNPQAILNYLQAFEKIGGENHGFVLIKDGEKVFERYCFPYSAEYAVPMFSVTKSLVSTAVGFAVSEKKMSLDDKIEPYFPEYKHKKGKEWDSLTVKKLLLMESNKKFSFLQDMTEDHTKLFMNAPFRKKKGFFYSNNDAHIVAHIVEKCTGESLVEYLYTRLFAPLGIQKPYWEKNNKGVCVGGSGVSLTTEDLAKIALCYLQEGKYNGQQVIPSFWAKEAVQKKTTPSKNFDADGFGYYFWQEKNGTYRIEGLFGQFGVVIPEYNAVVAVTGLHISDSEIAKTINDYLLPTLFDKEEEGSWEKLEEYLQKREENSKPKVSANGFIPEKKTYKRVGLVCEIAKLFTHFSNGLVPNALASSFAGRPKDSLDDICVEKKGTFLTVSWREETEQISFESGLDGEGRITDIVVLGMPHKVYSYAYFEKGRLHIVVKPLSNIFTKEFIIRFSQNKLKLWTKSTPDFRDFVVANSISGGVFPKDGILTPFLIRFLRTVLFFVNLPIRYRVKKK